MKNQLGSLFSTLFKCSLLILVLFNLSCNGIRNIDKRTSNDVGLPSFNMSSAPNNIDKVGFIFAIDKNNKQVPITQIDFSGSVTGETVVRSIQERRTLSWGALANFLGVPEVQLTANAGVEGQTTINTTIEFADELSINRANLLDIDKILAKKETEIINLVKTRKLEDLKFFLIIETIEGKSLKYNFDKTTLGNANIQANLQAIATNAQGKFAWDTKKAFKLEYNFEKPLIVFYKVFGLNLTSSIGGNTSLKAVRSNIVGDNGMLYLTK